MWNAGGGQDRLPRQMRPKIVSNRTDVGASPQSLAQDNCPRRTIRDKKSSAHCNQDLEPDTVGDSQDWDIEK